MSPARGRATRVVYSLPRVRRDTFIRQAELHRTLESTNTRALELAALDTTPLPYLVLTENQTAGKGRGSNIWWSSPGALTFSLVLDLAGGEAGPESWPRYALVAATAICEALEASAPNVPFGIRWPNDVYAGARKICGILPELYMGDIPRLVLGIGINANNSLESAPDPLRTRATSIYDAIGRRINPTDLLVGVLRSLEVRLGELSTNAPQLASAFSNRCLLRGHIVRLQIGDDFIEGRCEGIDPAGALLVRSGTQVIPYFGGSIQSVC